MEAESSSHQLSQDVQERYNAVVADPQLFMESLQRFLAITGTKFLLPVIGRRDLDLHGLFVEITQRGGIDKVCRDRRLKEVGRALHYSPSATNISFILRKYYHMLLAQFEEVYFFGADIGEFIPATDGEEPASIPDQRQTEPEVVPEVEATSTHKGGSVEPRPEASSSSTLKGAAVIGVIDDVINDGYVVTITVGDEKLKGFVLRQGQPTGQLSEQSSAPVKIPGRDSQEQHQKSSQVRKPDPADARFYRSGYHLFCKDQRAKLKPLYRKKRKELGAAIDSLWSNLPQSEKAIYQEKGLIYEEECRSEMKEHKQKLKSRMSHILAEVVPSSREPALPDTAPEVELVEQGLDVSVNPVEGPSPPDIHSN